MDTPQQRESRRLELKARAAFLRSIREFFDERGVIEVTTPELRPYTVTDRHVHSVGVPSGTNMPAGYLQTSPEYAMKQLLCLDSGPIYQICHCFRDDPAGRLHRSEFLMLEWYRPGFDHHSLMNEVDALLHKVLGSGPAQRFSYWPVLNSHTGVDAGTTIESLRTRLSGLGMSEDTIASLDVPTCLDLLVETMVLPNLGPGPTFLFDYPASQAALSVIGEGGVAERFELFMDGVELANGYHELRDPQTHRDRFALDQELRRRANLEIPEIDEAFLDALERGLPECAGVAVGLDRLFMLSMGLSRLLDWV